MMEQTVFCWSCGKACARARVICGHEDEYGRFQDASEMWLCDKCFYKRAESGEWKISGKTQRQIIVDCSMQSCASCGITIKSILRNSPLPIINHN